MNDLEWLKQHRAATSRIGPGLASRKGPDDEAFMKAIQELKDNPEFQEKLNEHIAGSEKNLPNDDRSGRETPI